VERLRKQIRIEQDLTRKFIAQITKDKLMQGNLTKFSTPGSDLKASLLTSDGSNQRNNKRESISGEGGR